MYKHKVVYKFFLKLILNVVIIKIILCGKSIFKCLYAVKMMQAAPIEKLYCSSLYSIEALLAY